MNTEETDVKLFLRSIYKGLQIPVKYYEDSDEERMLEITIEEVENEYV